MYQNGYYQPDFMNNQNNAPQYYNPYQYNPWANQMRMNNVTQQIDNSQNQIHGRFIGSLDDITVNEVDMNGKVSLFPVNDMSCIFVKQWTSDGKIKTVKYLPVQDEMPTNGNNERTQALQFDYTPINERFDRIEQMLSAKANTRVKKMEVENG